MNYKYTSIKSVLFNLSKFIPESQFNEADLIEWAISGMRKIKSEAKLDLANSVIQFTNHTADLPEDLVYLYQIKYLPKEDYTTITRDNIGLELADTRLDSFIKRVSENNNLSTAKIMRQSSSSFIPCISTNDTNIYPTCHVHEFTSFSNNTIRTTLKEGTLVISYARYTVDDSGDTLIPDNETVKQAILFYCLYNYFLKRSIMGEAGADKQAMYFEAKHETLAAKAAGELNTPDLNTMENLKNYNQRLVPRSNMFMRGFSSLSKPENIY
jgi:hypothetical protein